MGRNADCQYTDNQGRAQLQILEENIARLETHLQELQHPRLATPSVKLFDPHAAYHEAQGRRNATVTASASGSFSAAGAFRDIADTCANILIAPTASNTWWSEGDPPSHISHFL